MTTYVTVKDVELASAGMAWHGNGDHYLTAEHIADMVAADADPLIRRPRVLLGHLETWFGALAGKHDPTYDASDGMPGFGSIENLRTTEDGAKIVGDCVEVPDWFAESMASAYPTRSAEWVWDHETQGGRKYKAVLTDVAFGSWRPAVEDLADITREQATAALIALLQEGPEAAMAAVGSTEESPMAKPKTSSQTDKPSASVSSDRIARAFEKWAWGEVEDDDHIQGDPPPDTADWYWAWCRDIRVDPDELIACVEGETWAVPFSTDGEVTVTFGTPAQVRETYVPVVATASATTAEARKTQTVIARNLPKPDRPPKPNPAASRTTTETPAASQPDTERTHMDADVLKALAAKYGLPDSASEDDVNAAAVAAAYEALKATSPAETDDDEPGADVTTQTERDAADAAAVALAEADQKAAAEADSAKVPEPATASLTVPVDRAQFEEMQREIALGAQARREAQERDLDATVTAAVNDGRIAPTAQAAWRKAIDPGERPDATATARAAAEQETLASLAKNRLPVRDKAAPSAALTDFPEDKPLPDGVSLLTPHQRAELAARRA